MPTRFYCFQLTPTHITPIERVRDRKRGDTAVGGGQGFLFAQRVSGRALPHPSSCMELLPHVTWLICFDNWTLFPSVKAHPLPKASAGRLFVVSRFLLLSARCSEVFCCTCAGSSFLAVDSLMVHSGSKCWVSEDMSVILSRGCIY